MKLNKKKGFTIVELVIVIAVIAILAAVLIPNISKLVKKANASADESLVRNLNTALAMDTEKHATMSDALKAALDNGGYDVAKIVTKDKDNKILWDSVNDCFVYLDGENIKYLPESKTEEVHDWNYFEIFSEMPSAEALKTQKYSIYLSGEGKTVENKEVSVGFDSGKNTVKSLTYKNETTTAKDVVINTNGGTLTVNAEKDTVKHYGVSSVVTIENVATKSYHEYGTVGEIKLAAGRVVVEGKADVGSVLVTAESISTGSEKNVSVEVKSTAKLGAVGSTKGLSDLSKVVTGTDSVMTGAIDNSKFAGGFGTEKAPYLIADINQFNQLSEISDEVIFVKLTSDLTISEAINLSATGKSLTIDFNGANVANKFTVNADQFVAMNGKFSFAGNNANQGGDIAVSITANRVTFKNNTVAVIARTAVTIASKDTTISNNIFDSASNYTHNVIEFSQNADWSIENLIIADNVFNGASKNNCISMYQFAENANVTISDNTFGYVANAIRISNYSDNSADILLKNNSYTGTCDGQDRGYAGFIVFQRVSSEAKDSLTKLNVTIDNLTFNGTKILSRNNGLTNQAYYVYFDGSGLNTTENQPNVSFK